MSIKSKKWIQILMSALLVFCFSHPVYAADTASVSVRPVVTMETSGGNPAEGEFTIQLERITENAPLPARTEQTVRTKERKTADFQEIIFQEEGDYEYLLYESTGNVQGMRYDETRYTIRVHVEKDASDDRLKAETVAYAGGRSGKVSELVFRNHLKRNVIVRKPNYLNPSVDTGDRISFWMYEAVMLVSVLLIVLVVFAKRKKRHAGD